MSRYSGCQKLGVLFAFLVLLATLGSAHEVYVLPAELVNQSTSTASPNPFTALQGNQIVFALFIFIMLVTILGAFYVSTRQRFEESYAPLLGELKSYAPYVVQATLGLGLIASAATQNLFGPELSLHVLSENVPMLSLLLFMSGLLLLFNIETRITGLFSLFVYIVAFQRFDEYMLHYAGYLGLSLFVVLQNRHPVLDEFFAALFRTSMLPANWVKHPDKPYLLLRIFYGGAIMYAAIYAKYLYSNLALTTLEHHALSQYLPVEPLFIVLCMLILELAVGAAFLFGIGIRLATISLIGFNVMSFLIFSEALWPHIWLLGIAVALFLHGYDEYTVAGYAAQDRRFEPLL